MNENNLKTKKLVNFGPSGRAVAQPIDKSLLDNIFEHLTMERYANVQYFSMYLWFQERDLNGFASHFLSESQGEMEHACLLYTSPSPRDMRRSRMPSSA